MRATLEFDNVSNDRITGHRHTEHPGNQLITSYIATIAGSICMLLCLLKSLGVLILLKCLLLNHPLHSHYEIGEKQSG